MHGRSWEPMDYKIIEQQPRRHKGTKVHQEDVGKKDQCWASLPFA
jgi:hypothetical protein